ncbi:MAG: PAS domain-containing protein [Chloroflexi bacterium]|nr:PAS domain-containing protein [Chloroflexota bacterium]
MRPEEFDAKMSQVLTRLESMQTRARENTTTDAHTSREAIEELAIALEELQVADREFRDKTEQLAVSNQRYQDLFNFAPDVYIVTDKFGMIREANAAAAALFGVPTIDLIGHPLANWLEESGRSEFRRVINTLPAATQVRDRDAQFSPSPQHNEPIDAAISARVLRDRQQQVSGLLWLIRDIRARKHAERDLQAAQDSLRASEARFRLALDKAPVSVFSLNRDLRYTWVHHPTLGCAPDEMIGKTDAELLAAEDAEQLADLQRNAMEHGVTTRREVALHDCSGARRYFDLTVEPLRDDQDAVIGLLGAYIDVTDQQRARERLEAQVAGRTRELAQANAQLRSLTQRVVSVQEDERARISREIHDEAGQALTALKMMLEALRDDMAGCASELRLGMDDAVALTQDTMEQLRVLAYNLRPPALDAAQLNDVLEALCHEFSRRSNIPVQYRGMSVTEPPILMSITLYRFLQEALTNMVKHSQATEAQVMLRSDAEGIQLTVADNGRGFDWLAKRMDEEGPPQGIGLIGLEERLKTIGGTLEIHSEPGQGTRLVAAVPWKEAE